MAAIVDPMGNGRERLLATVNRRVDVLETERSHNRISEAAFLTGRILQEFFECTSCVGSSNIEGGSRRDPREVRIYLMARRVCDAKDILALQDRLRGRIGDRAVRVLRRIIGEGMTFPAAAAMEGKAGPRGTSFVAEYFRCALEDAVGAVQEVRGAARPAPDDKHLAASATAPQRQGKAIALGTSLARLEAERDHARRTGRLADGERATQKAVNEIERRIAELQLKQAMVAASS